MGKKLAWTVFFVLFVAIIAQQALSIVTQPARVKAWIESAVYQATGRKLTINGPVRITLSLMPTLQANDVHFQNMAHGTKDDMAVVDRIEARFYLPALLHHHILMTNLRLTGPTLLFEQVGGHPNWLFQTTPAPSAPPQQALSGADDNSYGFDIRSIWIKDGLIAWNLPERVGNLGIKAFDWSRSPLTNAVTMKATLIHAEHPLSVAMHADPEGNDLAPWKVGVQIAAAGAQLQVGGVAQLTGEYHLQLKGLVPKLEALSIYADKDLPPLRNATVTAVVNHPAGFGAQPDLRNVVIQAEGGDLTQWAPGLRMGATHILLPRIDKPAAIDTQLFWHEQPMPVSGTISMPKVKNGVPRVSIDLGGFWPAVPLHDLTLAGDIGFDQPHQTVQFDPLRMKAKEVDATITGDVVATTPVAVKAQAQVARLDADAFIPAATEKTDKWAWLETPLPWSDLSLANLSLSGHIGSLTLLKDHWDDIDLNVSLADGVLHRATIETKLSGSDVDATVTANAASQSVGVAMKATALPLALLLREAGMPAEAQGGFRVAVNLHGSGRNALAMSRTLDGPVNLRLEHGRMSNAALQAIAAPALEALGSKVPKQGQTAIACLGIEGAFNQGEGKLKDLAIDTTYLRMAGAGVVNFGDQTAALKLHPVAMLAGSMVSVPVVVKGPFAHMQAGLDANGFDAAGLMLDALFGGDTPNICGRPAPALPNAS